MNRFRLAIFLALLPVAAASGQVPPDKAISTFTVPDGLELTLFAAEPQLVNPTTMDIDHLGRVWVCEAVNYRRKMRGQPPLRKEGDRIVILADTTGTGKADTATVFYQSPDLMAPLGIAVAKDPVGPGWKVFVCQSPDILVFEDKDGDGKADGPPKKLLSGFGGLDHDHGVHGITIGPEGKLYFSVGDTGVHGLQSSDKKGRVWHSNDTDCRAGTIWKCNQDGTELELIAHNFRNEYKPAVDSFGNVWITDNDDDGNQQTRLCYVMPGGDYGYHPRGPGQTHWHEEQPGVVPKALRTYFGSPTGNCFYEGTLLPKKYWGQLIGADAGPRQIRCYHIKENGAGYDVDREDMVTSKDNWFRASDVVVAPDGSLFIADWYDPGVGGHGMGDWTRGRIYRLAPKGNKYSVPKVDLTTNEGLLKAFASPNLATRAMTLAKLSSTPFAQTLPVLKSAAQSESATLEARALWQLLVGGFKAKSEEARDVALQTVNRETPGIREFVVRIFRGSNSSEFRDMTSLSGNEFLPGKSPTLGLNRELLVAMRDLDPKNVKDLILKLVKDYDGHDRFYLEAIGIAVGHHDQKRREIILADFEKHFPEWNDKVADLVWELRPPSMMPTLGKRLADASLTPAQRGRIVDILAADADPKAGVVLLNVLHTDIPAEVREHVLSNLTLFLPGKWRALRDTKDLDAAIDQLLAKPAGRGTGLALVAAAERKDKLAQVKQIAADATETAAVRREAIKTLGALPSVASAEVLASISGGNDIGLATSAATALGGFLPGRPARDGKPTDRPGSAVAMKQLQQLTLGKDTPVPVRTAAFTTLAGSWSGAGWLLEAHQKKELPAEFVASIGMLLRNSPYRDQQNKAMIAFPPAGKLDPKKLPPLPVLAARKGDAVRGKQLLAKSLTNEMQCLKCHSVRGVGGHVGPDLSMIGKKASRENLFESILYPSKAIADQYVSWVITTKNDLIVTGLLVEETPDAVLLRDANGKDTRIAKKDIESRAKDAKSLMPDNLVVTLSEDELVDAVEYLFGLKEALVSPDAWSLIGPFDNGDNDAGLDAVYPPEKGIDLKGRYKGKHAEVGWRTVRPDQHGYVDLQALFAGESDQIVSYSYREVESPADQDATILLGTDDGGKLWVNGKLVYTCRDHRAATPEQDAVKVRLVKGVNTLLLKVNNGDGAHGFYLSVQGEQELKFQPLR